METVLSRDWYLTKCRLAPYIRCDVPLPFCYYWPIHSGILFGLGYLYRKLDSQFVKLSSIFFELRHTYVQAWSWVFFFYNLQINVQRLTILLVGFLFPDVSQGIWSCGRTFQGRLSGLVQEALASSLLHSWRKCSWGAFSLMWLNISQHAQLSHPLNFATRACDWMGLVHSIWSV